MRSKSNIVGSAAEISFICDIYNNGKKEKQTRNSSNLLLSMGFTLRMVTKINIYSLETKLKKYGL